MTRAPVFLHDFQSQPAKYHSDQGAILEWIAAAHAQAELTLQQPATEAEREAIIKRFRKLVLRFGCSTDRIAFRNSSLLLPGRRGRSANRSPVSGPALRAGRGCAARRSRNRP